ncbi:hypothetical protein [Bradyrhizobium mercantei]|uniref:hypothetical protein n=1 Tax=Bradyrhizobium mercantei TaxID=1904807 RepID=UPI001177F638|nr:hypothetical protein [Bradyrhizobium mercantei]
MTDKKTNNDANGDAMSASTFLESLYGDPLSEETMRTARYLIVISAICMTAVLFNVRLQPTSLIPLDFGGRSDVLSMLLVLGVLLLLVNFLLRASTDLLRDRETGVLVTRYIEGERTKAALASARSADDYMVQQEREMREGDYTPDPEPWWDAYGKVEDAANAAVRKAEGRIGIRRLPRVLRHVRKSLEVCVPIAIALLALTLARTSLAGFAKALVGAFAP